MGRWGLVGSEDRSYRTPLVRSLHGHHYWPFYYGDGPLEEQSTINIILFDIGASGAQRTAITRN